MFPLPTYLAILATAAAAALDTCTTGLSCSVTNADTCCVESPGGVLLLTQFWDYDPTTGPEDAFTLHGLWPDNCDGTYDSFCNKDIEVSSVQLIISSFDSSLLKDMQTYWPDYEGDNDSFWVHEFNKHGTCVSTINPSCYSDFTQNENVHDFFKVAMNLYKKLPTYEYLAAEGIVPSETATYTSAQIDAALKKHFGKEVYFKCDDNKVLNEIWYFHNIRGPLTGEDFVAIDRLQDSSCPSTGIKFTPKGKNPVNTATATATTATATATTGSGSSPTSGSKGYLKIDDGCAISSGKYYTSGTCATYTVTGSQLKSSKGICGVQDDVFTCGNGASTFSFSNGNLGYNGKYKWCVKGSGDQKDIYLSDGSCQEYDFSFSTV